MEGTTATPVSGRRALLTKCKGLSLTYPRAPEHWTKEYVRDKLMEAAGDVEIEYAVIAKEDHADGTPHFHAFVMLKRKKNTYVDTWDIDGHHGNYQATRSFSAWEKYIKKDDNYLVFGEFDPEAKLAAASGKTAYVCQLILKEGCISQDLMDKYPEILLNYDRYNRNLSSFLQKRAAAEVDLPEPDRWYGWQEHILNELAGTIHPRKVYWIYDHGGNKGKSFLAKWITTKLGGFYSDGKRDDVLYAYAGQRIVVFDLAREKQDDKYFYGTIEKLKNGQYFSGKYESRFCVWNHPHIVCFANFGPDWDKLSMDRWDVWEIQDTPGYPATRNTSGRGGRAYLLPQIEQRRGGGGGIPRPPSPEETEENALHSTSTNNRERDICTETVQGNGGCELLTESELLEVLKDIEYWP